MENELYSHHFGTDGYDLHFIHVYKNMIIYEITNWGGEEADLRCDREEYTHQLFYDRHKNDENCKPVIEFLKMENMIETTQK